MNKKQKINLIGAGTLTALIAVAGFSFNSGGVRAVAADAFSSTGQSILLSEDAAIHAENDQLRDAITQMQDREAQYAQQIEQANVLLQEQSQAGYGEGEEHEEHEEHEEMEEAESHGEAGEDSEMMEGSEEHEEMEEAESHGEMGEDPDMMDGSNAAETSGDMEGAKRDNEAEESDDETSASYDMNGSDAVAYTADEGEETENYSDTEEEMEGAEENEDDDESEEDSD